MQISVEVAPLSDNGAVNLIWIDGFEIEFSIVDSKTAIKGSQTNQTFARDCCATTNLKNRL
jgi:hypothetical protein